MSANASILDGSNLLYDSFCNDSFEATILDLKVDDNDKFEKIVQQNAKLIDEMKKIWLCFTRLSQSVEMLQKEKENLRTKNIELKTHVNDLDAYGRRNNIEMRNIESVKDENLEQYCIDVLASIDVHVSSNDIGGLHRLGKPSHGEEIYDYSLHKPKKRIRCSGKST